MLTEIESNQCHSSDNNKNTLGSASPNPLAPLNGVVMAATHHRTLSQQQQQQLQAAQQQHQNNISAANLQNHLAATSHHRFAPYPLHQPHLAGTHPHNTLYHQQITQKIPLGDFYPQQQLTNKSLSSRSRQTQQQEPLPNNNNTAPNNPFIAVASTSGTSSSSNPTMYDSTAGSSHLYPPNSNSSKSRYLLQSTLLQSAVYHPAMTPSELAQMENYIRSRRASPPALVAAFNQYHQHLQSMSHHLHQSQLNHHQTDLSEGTIEDVEEEEEQQVGTHISQLFPEILTEIFSKLSVRDRGRASQVCTAWRDAAYSKCCWRGEEATLHLRRATPFIFNSLIRRGIRKVQVLSLRRTLKDVVFGLPQLESLNLSGCYNVTDLNLGHSFSADLPNLKVLDLSLCKQITDTSLSRIAQHLKNLEVLELGGCSNITNTGLLLIAWGLKKLRHLNLRSCWHISDQGIGHLAGLSKETAEGNHQLEYLGLQDCQRLSDESLKHISEGLPSLRSINLSFCVSITDSGLKYLSKMPLLEELNLRACDNVSDIGMSYLAADNSSNHRGGSDSPQTTTIRALDVSFCDKIGDQALMAISHGLFHLRSLSLSACSITDEGLDRISKSLHDLQTLNIGQCARVTDVGLKALGENCLNLKAIDLYGCTKISAQGLNQVMKLPKLATLNLGLWHVR